MYLKTGFVLVIAFNCGFIQIFSNHWLLFIEEILHKKWKYCISFPVWKHHFLFSKVADAYAEWGSLGTAVSCRQYAPGECTVSFLLLPNLFLEVFSPLVHFTVCSSCYQAVDSWYKPLWWNQNSNPGIFVIMFINQRGELTLLYPRCRRKYFDSTGLASEQR